MPKDDVPDEEGLREEALAEWLSRGHAMQDFTMEKMWKLWADEDDDDDDGDDDDDDDGLADKQELMKGYDALGPLLEHAKDVAKQLKETAKVEGKKALATAWKYAELPPLRNRRLLRQHVIHVREMDADTHKYSLIRQRIASELDEAREAEKELQFGLKKRNKRQAPLLRRFQEMKLEADKLQQAQLTEDIEQRRRERVDLLKHEKQRQLDERQQRTIDQQVRRRQLNLKFWQKQLVEARTFAEQQTLNQQRTEEFDSKVEAMRQEIRQVEAEEAADADSGADRRVTTTSIGIFDTVFDPGEWHSATDGGDRRGLGSDAVCLSLCQSHNGWGIWSNFAEFDLLFVWQTDEYTIGLSSARAFVIENERKRNELMEIQSKVLMLREKLEQVDHAKTALALDRRTILERKDAMLQEIKQVRMEQDELNDLLAGPPRRDPSEREKRQFHTLVTRRAGYMKQLSDLDSRLSTLQKRSEIILRSEASFLPLLEGAEQMQTVLEAQVDALEETRHDLPMVVGKSIFQPEGVPIPAQVDGEGASITQPFLDPIKVLKQVTMESKLEILRTAAMPVNDHYKKAKATAIEAWKVNEHRALAGQELDDTKARLAKVRDHYIEHQTTSLRSDLAYAVRKFHQDGTKLRPCIFPLKGQFEWWCHQIPQKSTGLSFSTEQNAICLGPGQSSGRITGCIRLPKRCFYRIQMSAIIQRSTSEDKGGEAEAILPTEDWKLFLGPELDSLQHRVFRDVGGNLLQTGDGLSFEFCGSRLCFSLEIMRRGSTSLSPSHSYYTVGNVGKYTERLEDFREEETRERLLQREKHFVSELVKTIRMQAKRTSSQRATELLQELILVERSRAKLWDSSLFHGYSQRFKRAEYVNMLRGEIKKEIAVQIDADIAVRQGRIRDSLMLTVGVPIAEDSSTKTQRKDLSRMDFQTRKSALLEPQKLAVTTLLGDYCSFKALQASADSSYRKETMIVGVRYEWREARTKLHVMHKLCGPSERQDSLGIGSESALEWLQLENVNAVFLASACAPALARRREDEAASRILLAAKDEGIQQLQLETQQHLVEESEAVVREAKEDELLAQQMQQELARRARLFYADAIRLTTYNDSVSSQIDFQVQRQVNVLTQQGAASNPVVLEPIMGQLKASFARQYVHGKLALVRKTWERKAKRLASKRSKARAERAFRIQQEHQLVAEINADNDRELAKLRIEQGKRAKEVLCIPNFHRVIDSSRVECEHRELKAWGGKYGSGLKCKRCGKEMAQSFDDPAQMYGADRELDADIRQHRAQMTSGVSFRFRSADHLSRVENERLRLEKEAREMEESEALLYDRVAPKAIDDFDFRHGINRGTLLATADSSDPLYPRLIQEIHHASFQDEILFHGRLRNFHFRIQQIGQQHAEYSTRLALQRAFLENEQREAGIVLAKLPLLELDQARAVALIEEDLNAQKCLEDATKRLTAAQLEREAARHAIEGVEEDAEFSEFHAPALVRSSEEMAAVYHRIQMEVETVDSQLLKSKERLAKAILEREGAQPLLSRLYCRTPKSILRTRFGFVRVEFYRTEDCCVVVKPLHWQATLYLPIDEILAFEAVYKEQESVEMAAEDASGHRFIRLEQAREALERRKMQVEEQQICDITAWRKTKEVEEQLLTSAVCREELEAQLKYETEDQKTTLESAKKEAIRLQRSGRIYPARKRRPLTQRPGRLDARRVTRASEKRLAMAAIERKLLEKERSLRQDSERQRNAGGMATLASEVFDSLLQDVTKELGEEQKQQSRYEAQERIRTNGAAVSTSQNGLPIRLNDETTLVRTQLGLERLWVVRKKQYTLLHTTWRQEFAKLQLVRDEMARREELRRLAEEERLRLEARRKEMLAEERLTRRFYMEEMVLYIQERKAMATAEVEMREYLRQLELEAMKTKYAQMVEDRTRVNDKAARRLEIKLGKNEQHRLHREWRQIKDEDDLSMQIREQELARASAEALERQFDLFLADQAFQGQVSAELEANRVAARLLEAQHAAEEKRKNFKAKVTQERMIATVETFYCLTRVEVEWMEATERQQFWQLQATPLASKLRVMKPELERIQYERQHVVADATAKREMATTCRKRIVDADLSLEIAIQVKDKALFTYKKLHKLNATMDSAVLHDRMQRFRTSYLSQQLHQRYFALLVESVVRRAIVEASEREIARLEDHIKQLEVERLVKGKEVGRLQRKRRRSQRLRLRRAELGAQMFGNSRKRTLKAMFERWARLWTQRVRVRMSFKLKHELLLQKQKLTATSNSPLLKNQSLLRQNQAAPSLPTKLSTIHDHQKRLLRCRLCRVEYSEQQNTRFACVYHPGTFEFACIRTCETRQSAAKGPAAVPASCMLHRAKRWLCCDETEEGRHGSSGCKRRFHLPIRENPELKALVERTTKQEQTLLEKVNQQLLELQERNVVGKMKLATKAVVSKMEGELAKKRTTAAKFHTLDRRV